MMSVTVGKLQTFFFAGAERPDFFLLPMAIDQENKAEVIEV
jgi:hypothetical protein